MKKCVSLLTAYFAFAIVITVSPAVAPKIQHTTKADATVKAVCKNYTGRMYERCIGKATNIAKNYPQIMKRIEKSTK